MKRTRKYVSGYRLMSELVTPTTLRYIAADNARLYAELGARGYRWDGQRGEWSNLPAADIADMLHAQAGARIIRIRVMADKSEIEEAALRVIQGCMSEDIDIISQSAYYGSKRNGWVRTYITAKMRR